MKIDMKAKFLGGLLGSAIGDAVGELAFRQPQLRGLIDLVESSLEIHYTDDTAMAIGLAESLIQSGGLDQQDLGETFRKNYLREPWRGYASGPPTLFAMVLKEMIPYTNAAKQLFEGQGSLGNGAAMRVAPLGLLFYDDPQLYEKAGDKHKAATTYNAYAEMFPSPLEPAIEALYKAGQMHLAVGRDYYYRIQLEKIYEADMNGGTQRTNRTRYLAAQAAFVLAEPHYERYANVRLVEPIRRNMQLKKQLMEQALKAYNKAADLGVAEYTTAATYRIADMYADFSRKLMDSDRPRNLDDEEMEQYEIMLEEQAFPFEEQAIALHETNIKRMHNDGLYNEWIDNSIKALATLMPARYSRNETYAIAAETAH